MDSKTENKLRQIFSVAEGEDKIKYTTSDAMDKFWQFAMNNTDEAKEFAQNYGLAPVIVDEAIGEVEKGNFFNNGIVSSDLHEIKECQDNLNRLRTLGVDFLSSRNVDGKTVGSLLQEAMKNGNSKNNEVWQKIKIVRDKKALYFPLEDLHAFVKELEEQKELKLRFERERAKEIMKQDNRYRRLGRIKRHFNNVKDKIFSLFSNER